jgi:hypothetical protein
MSLTSVSSVQGANLSSSVAPRAKADPNKLSDTLWAIPGWSIPRQRPGLLDANGRRPFREQTGSRQLVTWWAPVFCLQAW